MAATAKTSREQVSEQLEQKEEFRESLTSWYLKGIERIAEVQKKGIDVAVQQNAELLDIWKKMADKIPGVPRLVAPELVANTFERFGETGKSAIDLVVDQTHALADLAHERSEAAKKATEGAASVMQQVVERSVASQKKILEHSAAQTKAMVESARQQFGFSGGAAEAVSNSIQHGVDTIVETQKEMLDLVTH